MTQTDYERPEDNCQRNPQAKPAAEWRFQFEDVGKADPDHISLALAIYARWLGRAVKARSNVSDRVTSANSALTLPQPHRTVVTPKHCKTGGSIK